MNSEIYALLVLCSVLALIAFVVSLICVAIIAGFVRSTHTVQYLPHDNTDAFKPDPELVEDNEAALLNKVGRKKKPEKPTVVEDLDAPIEEINQSDILY